MMYFKMVNKKGELYMAENMPDDNLSILYCFLKDDVNESAPSWIQSINDTSRTFHFSNYCALKKKDNNIILGCHYDFGDQDEFYKNAITVSISSLTHILTEWAKICEHGAEEVTIYLDGKELSIEWVPKQAITH